MASDPRTYIRLHDGMPDHPKVFSLSDPAFRALIELWCWCSRHLTDGLIPAAVMHKLVRRSAWKELVAAELVAFNPDGFYRMHDYLEHQRSAGEVAALRAKRAEAGARGGRAKANRVASASRLPDPEPGKSVAESETQAETEEQPGASSSAPASPERDDVTVICDRLAEAIFDHRKSAGSAKRRPSVTQAWRVAAAHLLGRDKRSVAQVIAAIEWCQQDEFWATNIESMPKLRERWDQLRADARKRPAGRAVNGNGSRPSTTDNRVGVGMGLVAQYEAEERMGGQ